MHRLFVGLRPPGAMRAALLAAMGGVAGARWQSEDQLHITLRFIGAVDGRAGDDIAAALGQLHAPAPEVALRGVGRFDRVGDGDVLWAGLSPQRPLAALHAKVDRALVRCGLPPEGRAYVPHITLARLPRGLAASREVDAFIARGAALASPTARLEHLILFESELASDGARYHIVERWPLA